MSLNRISERMLDQEFVQKVNDHTDQLAQNEKKTDGILSVTEYLTDTTGTTDNAQQLRDAVSNAKTNKKKLHVPRWVTVRVDSTVDMTGIDLDIQGTIKSYVDHAPAIIIGGSSTNVIPCVAHINWITKGNTLNVDDIGVRVVGVKNGKITIMWDYYTQLWTDENTAGRTSISYSDFWLGKIDVLELYGMPGLSWITDCNFYGGRYGKILIGNSTGTYSHNNNVFYKPCVEGGEIRIIKGSRNIFYDVRSEAGTKYYLEANCNRNVIYDNYVSSNNAITGLGTVEYDNGFENVVISSVESVYERIPLVILDRNTQFINNVCEFNIVDASAFIKNGNNKYTPTAWKQLFNIDFDTSYIRRIGFESDGTVFRATLGMYDSLGNIIDNSSGSSSAGSSWDATNKERYFTANISKTEFGIMDSNAKTAKLGVSFGGSLTGLEFGRLIIYVEVKRKQSHYVESLKKSLETPNFSKLVASGTTRPTSPKKGEPYIDETLNKTIWWNGSVWEDAMGATV